MRPDLDATFLRIAQVLAERAACARRQVGCVVVNRDNQIVSTGYNGRARTQPNCEGSITCINDCEGVHAEVNALLLAAGQGYRVYLTHAPCWHCMKTIVNSGVKYVYYSNAETLEERSALLAGQAGIRLRQRAP